MADSDVQVKFGATTGDFTSRVAELNAALRGVSENTLAMTGPATEAAEGMGKLSLATSGVSTELIRLGHEAISGNFSRMPGSLLVLTSRMGGLTGSFVAGVAAAAAIAFTIGDIAFKANEAAGEVAKLNVQTQAMGKGGFVDGDVLEKEIDRLASLPGMTRTMSEDAVEDFTQARNVGGEMILKLTDILNDFAAATGRKVPEAAKILATAFSDPAKGAEELQRIFNDQLNPSLINTIINEAKMGETLKAQSDLWKLVEQQVSGANEKALSPVAAIMARISELASAGAAAVKNFFKPISDFMNIPNKFMEAMAPQEMGVDQQSQQQAAADAKAAEAAAQRNSQLEQSLELSRTIGGETEKLVTLEDKLAQLKRGENLGTPADKQQIVAAEKQVQDEIANLKNEGIEKEAAGIAEERSLYEQNAQDYAETQELMVAKKQETLEQEFQNLKANLDRERAAVAQSFADQQALYSVDSKEWEKLENEKLSAAQKFQNDYDRLLLQQQEKETAALDKMLTGWNKAIDEMDSDTNKLVSNFFTRTQTMSQAFQQFAQRMVISFTTAVLQIMAKNALLVVAQNAGWLQMSAALIKSLGQWQLVESEKTAATVTQNAARQASDQTSNSSFLMMIVEKIGKWITGETAETAATVSGNAIRTASDNASAVAGLASQKASQTAEIMGDAGLAAAGTYASVAQIPYVGWIMAPGAAAAAFTDVMSYAAFDKGTDYVPHDQLAFIHKGERIIPAAQNAALSKTTYGQNSGGGDTHVHFNISAMDSQDVKKAMLKNSAAIGAAVKSAARGNSGGMRVAFSRM